MDCKPDSLTADQRLIVIAHQMAEIERLTEDRNECSRQTREALRRIDALLPEIERLRALHAKHCGLECCDEREQEALREGRLLEIKTARSAEGWGEPGSDAIPEFYTVQVQHLLMVTQLPVAELYEVPADRELQDSILEAELEFWHYVESGVQPPIDYRAPGALETVKRLHLGHERRGSERTATQDGARFNRLPAPRVDSQEPQGRY